MITNQYEEKIINTIKIIMIVIKLFIHLVLLCAVMCCLIALVFLSPYEDSTPMWGIDPLRVGFGVEVFQLFFGYNAFLSLLYCRKSRFWSLFYMILCTACLMRLSWFWSFWCCCFNGG